MGSRVEGEPKVTVSFRTPISTREFLLEKAKKRKETVSDYVNRIVNAQKVMEAIPSE